MTGSIGIGIVERKTCRLPLEDGGLALDHGGRLAEVEVAYETYGELNEARDNVVVICHALTGDAHVAGRHAPDDRKPGWWDPMVGPAKAIDTNRFFVICSNVLGGCRGTTGPASTNPATGRPYGLDFPEITVGDMVEVQRRLLAELGVEQVYAVIGGSMGGMQVLEWAVRFPKMVRKALCIASGECYKAQALAFDVIGRNMVMADKNWREGRYGEEGEKPVEGLALARMLGHVTYLSAESMAAKFGRERRHGFGQGPFQTDFQVESYLDYQGRRFVERFDANSYLYITLAADLFSLTERAGTVEDTLEAVEAELLVLALSSDWLFPPEQSRELAGALLRAGKDVTYCELESPYGHDAFLLEIDQLSRVVSSYLLGSSDAEKSRAAQWRDRDLVNRFAGTRAEAIPEPSPYWNLDLGIIERLVPKGARVLDLGCGDGTLLARLRKKRDAQGMGVDNSLANLIQCNVRHIPLFEADLDHGLSMIPDDTYDCAVLSETLQEVHRPEVVVREMLRVAREGILSFPNLGNWRYRARLALTGREPGGSVLDFGRLTDADQHLFSLADFERFCARLGVRILETICIPRGPVDRAAVSMGLRNFGAQRVVVRIARRGVEDV